MTTQEMLNRQGQKYIKGLADMVHVLWEKMCEDVGIPEDSKFVEVSVLEASKYHKFYDIALCELWAAQREYAAGGYVGLRIVAGRAS